MPIFRQDVFAMTKQSLALTLTLCLFLGSCRLLSAGQPDLRSNLVIESYSIKKEISGKPSSQHRYVIRIQLSQPHAYNAALTALFDDCYSTKMTAHENGTYILETNHALNQKSMLRFYVKGSKDTLRLGPPLTIKSELRQ
jgi:hypothetical protein